MATHECKHEDDFTTMHKDHDVLIEVRTMVRVACVLLVIVFTAVVTQIITGRPKTEENNRHDFADNYSMTGGTIENERY